MSRPPTYANQQGLGLPFRLRLCHPNSGLAFYSQKLQVTRVINILFFILKQ